MGNFRGGQSSGGEEVETISHIDSLAHLQENQTTYCINQLNRFFFVILTISIESYFE